MSDSFLHYLADFCSFVGKFGSKGVKNKYFGGTYVFHEPALGARFDSVVLKFHADNNEGGGGRHGAGGGVLRGGDRM